MLFNIRAVARVISAARAAHGARPQMALFGAFRDRFRRQGSSTWPHAGLWPAGILNASNPRVSTEPNKGLSNRRGKLPESKREQSRNKRRIFDAFYTLATGLAASYLMWCLNVCTQQLSDCRTKGMPYISRIQQEGVFTSTPHGGRRPS